MTIGPRSETRQLGARGPSVFPLALGAMGMSGTYGPADDRESIATIHASADLARIEEAVAASKVAGQRYDDRQMRMLDSER